jgi:hypothetical protein
MYTVAIAYVLQKTPYVFPIIGGRKVEHMLANIEALSISLTPEQISSIESVTPFNPGFPHTIIVSCRLPDIVIHCLTPGGPSGGWYDHHPCFLVDRTI